MERVDPYILPTHQDRDSHSLSRERDSRSISLERQDFGSSSRYDSFQEKPPLRNPDPPTKSQFPIPFGPSKAAGSILVSLSRKKIQKKKFFLIVFFSSTTKN